MKNIIKTLAIAVAMIPAMASASTITPGVENIYGVDDCKFARGNQAICQLSERVYQLEVVVQELQQENVRLQLQESLSSETSVYDCENRISGVEKRMTTIEKAVNFLQVNIVTALQMIIQKISK